MIPSQTSSANPEIRFLKGVGPKKAEILQRIGIQTIRDLLFFFPRRHEDRSQLTSIESLKPGQTTAIQGEVLSVKFKPVRQMPLVDVTVGDSSGFIHAVWFKQPYLKNIFKSGQKVILFGKADLYQDRLQMNSPEYEFVESQENAIHTGRIVPIYPLTEGLFQKSLRLTLKNCLDSYLKDVIQEYLPESFIHEHSLLPLPTAVQEQHFPTCTNQLEASRKRLVFDEFLLFQITLLQKIRKIKNQYVSVALKNAPLLIDDFKSSLPFALTDSQNQAMLQIAEDIKLTQPMNRLLHGDVGSGKTVLAAFALFAAAKHEQQAALLVPTEILAEQHFRSISKLLAPHHLSPTLITSSTPPDKRERVLAELKQGKIPILIGTHAMLQSDVQFLRLALLIIDEQHKFGVHQRCQLLQAAPRPHHMVMTATPIPRTLALTLYGDLDVSTLRELPKGRQPIQTYWITRSKQHEVLLHVKKKVVDGGDQAYFIFPLIDETEKADLLAAKQEFERLKKGVFKDIKMGLVHGRLHQEERTHIMKGFIAGEVKILIATSVIEVGVDNPNATLMIIENAERFGLSQLHQMRGRIGRGTKPSECYLFGEPVSEEGKKRLRIMTKSSDGFQIAEEDLKLRGPGDFWGTRQSGAPLFQLGDPFQDEALLLFARETAKRLVYERKLDFDPLWQPLKKFLDQIALKY